MTDNNGMVTLNIYDNPPPQLADETSAKINQTDQDLNLNTDKPKMNPNFYDNVRNDQQNYNSAPRNYNNNARNTQSSVDESSESTQNNQNNTPGMAVPPQNMKYPQYPPQQYYQQVPVRPATLGAPMVPMAYQYNNMAYAQPIVVQGQQQPVTTNQPIKNAPRTIVIREQERIKDNNAQDCCAGCLAACAACLTCCCLMALCAGGGRGHRGGPHGRW